MTYKINLEKCVGCGTCAEECPNDAIKEAGGKYTICADDCVDCGSCVDACPESAILEE